MSIHLLTRLYQKSSRCIPSGLRSDNSLYLNGLWRLEESKNYFRCSALKKAPVPQILPDTNVVKSTSLESQRHEG
jgi:hypothetical protein